MHGLFLWVLWKSGSSLWEAVISTAFLQVAWHSRLTMVCAMVAITPTALCVSDRNTCTKLRENVSTVTKHITTNSNQRLKKYQIIDIDSNLTLKKATSLLHSHQQLVCFLNLKEELFDIMISELPLLQTTHSSLYYFFQSSNPHWPLLTHCLHFSKDMYVWNLLWAKLHEFDSSGLSFSLNSGLFSLCLTGFQ